MPKLSKTEWDELCMLSVLDQQPVSGLDMLLEIDKRFGLKTMHGDHCFSDLHINGYCFVLLEDHNGEQQGIYHISPKGRKRLAFLQQKKEL